MHVWIISLQRWDFYSSMRIKICEMLCRLGLDIDHKLEFLRRPWHGIASWQMPSSCVKSSFPRLAGFLTALSFFSRPHIQCVSVSGCTIVLVSYFPPPSSRLRPSCAYTRDRLCGHVGGRHGRNLRKGIQKFDTLPPPPPRSGGSSFQGGARVFPRGCFAFRAQIGGDFESRTRWMSHFDKAKQQKCFKNYSLTGKGEKSRKRQKFPLFLVARKVLWSAFCDSTPDG